MPITRSQTINTKYAGIGRPNLRSAKNKKDFIDPKEDPTESAKAMDEIKEMCKKIKQPKIKKVPEQPEYTSDTDPDFDPDEDWEDTDSLAAIEEEMKARVPPEKFDEYMALKEHLEKSEPNLTNLLDLELDHEEKVNILEQFMIYASTPVGFERLDLKKKIKQLCKPVHPEIKRLKGLCPEVGDDIEDKIIHLETLDQNKIILYQKYQIYNNMAEMDEKNGMESWFRLALNLPYNKLSTTPIENKIKFLSQELDRRLYGMQKFKNHILVEINRYLHNPKNTRNIALKGPPGIGKTSVIKIVSESMGIPFYAINAGGIDIDSLIGCNYAYRGAHEGEITRAMQLFNQYGHANKGFIYFDEYDKIGGTEDEPGSRDSASVQAELIRVTDKTQNSRFKDLYLMGLEQNLENVLFFFSMNYNPRNSAMLDRLTVIEMDGYNQKEKIIIAKRHLIPEAVQELNLQPEDIVFDDGVIIKIAIQLEEEKGVRSFKQVIQYIVNMIYFRVTNPDISEIYGGLPSTLPVRITEDVYYKLHKYLNLDKKYLSYYI